MRKLLPLARYSCRLDSDRLYGAVFRISPSRLFRDQTARCSNTYTEGSMPSVYCIRTLVAPNSLESMLFGIRLLDVLIRIQKGLCLLYTVLDSSIEIYADRLR
jgi:hypothetical protein